MVVTSSIHRWFILFLWIGLWVKLQTLRENPLSVLRYNPATFMVEPVIRPNRVRDWFMVQPCGFKNIGYLLLLIQPCVLHQIQNGGQQRIPHFLPKCWSLQSELEFEPRYPLFGGWRATFIIGYRVPLEDYLFEAPDGRRYLNFTFGCPLVETIVDKLTIKVGFYQYLSFIQPLLLAITR